MSDPPGGQPRRARNLLSSYYGASVAAPAAEEVDDMNIDGSNFNADKYTSHLLQYKSLPELMQRGIAMVSEIKSLDSDMQMLVCAHGASNRTQPTSPPTNAPRPPARHR